MTLRRVHEGKVAVVPGLSKAERLILTAEVGVLATDQEPKMRTEWLKRITHEMIRHGLANPSRNHKTQECCCF